MNPLRDLEPLLESDELYAKACVASTATTVYRILASEPIVKQLATLIWNDPTNITRILTYVRRLLHRDPPTEFRFYNDIAISCVLIAASQVADENYAELVTSLSKQKDILLGWIPAIAALVLRHRQANSVRNFRWVEMRALLFQPGRPFETKTDFPHRTAHSSLA